METINNAIEIEDVIYYTEKLKKNESVSVRYYGIVYIITKEKKDVYNVTKDGMQIANGNKFSIAAEIKENSDSWNKTLETEMKVGELRKQRLAENPDYFKPVTIYVK